MQRSLIRISELAKKAGVLASTVRHYTDLGLVRPAMETQGGHRLYDEDMALACLRRIHLLARRGQTLDEIKAQLSQGSRVCTVLLVDDDPVVVDFIRSVFDLYSGKPMPGGAVLPLVRLETARDGFEAGRRCGDLAPDLVILDLMLPGINGFGVCRAIRQDQELGALVKILAITGFDTPANKAEITAAGANEYLAKPFTLDEFASSLKRLGILNGG